MYSATLKIIISYYCFNYYFFHYQQPYCLNFIPPPPFNICWSGHLGGVVDLMSDSWFQARSDLKVLKSNPMSGTARSLLGFLSPSAFAPPPLISIHSLPLLNFKFLKKIITAGFGQVIWWSFASVFSSVKCSNNSVLFIMWKLNE